MLGRLARWMARKVARDALLDADDFFQEGALAVARAIARGGLGPGLFSAVARSGMKDAWRRLLRQEAETAAAVVAQASACRRPVLEPEEVLDLRLAVDRLPAPIGHAVRLHHFEGRTHDEAAAVQGACHKTVFTRLKQARECLRGGLGPDWEEEFGRSVPLRRPASWRDWARRPGKARGEKGRNGGRTAPTREKVAAKLAMIESAAELRRRTS